MKPTVLMLDQTWQPSGIITMRQALILLLRGKAVPVTTEYVGVLRSPSQEYPVPSVIQVGAAVRQIFTQAAPHCSRRGVLTRDNNECQFMVGGRGCTRHADTVDHLLPQSRGGLDTWENLVAACFEHNTTKDDRTLEEMEEKFGWKLKRKPYAPKYVFKSLEAMKEVHPSWVYYLGVENT